ncbi:hypothetical protein HYW17_04985 [Candidatus Uhrbacteria bacterium]|nr:hypothetical protein [Candidatus Uhrbacteria bacterium]
MAYDPQGQGQFGARPQRQMYDVSQMGLTCAQCGNPITELPFQPSADRPVYCFDCNKARRRNFKRDRF